MVPCKMSFPGDKRPPPVRQKGLRVYGKERSLLFTPHSQVFRRSLGYTVSFSIVRPSAQPTVSFVVISEREVRHAGNLPKYPTIPPPRSVSPLFPLPPFDPSCRIKSYS